MIGPLGIAPVDIGMQDDLNANAEFIRLADAFVEVLPAEMLQGSCVFEQASSTLNGIAPTIASRMTPTRKNPHPANGIAPSCWNFRP